MEFTDLLDLLRNPTDLITAVGTAGITAIIFIETGLLFPFLPGDSLLVTAGLLASKTDGPIQLDIMTLGILGTIASVAGNQVSFFIGRRMGRALYSRPDSRWFKRKHLEQAQAYYDKHGGKTIVIARFMPFVRTFAPFVAGIGRMPYPRYIAFCIGGALLWVVSLTMLGYFFGNIPVVKRNLTPVIFGIIGLSLLPMVFSYLKSRRAARPQLPAG